MVCPLAHIPVRVPLGYDVGIVKDDPHELIPRVGGERFV